MDAVAEAGAEWIGFVFFAASPRVVTPGVAGILAARYPGGPRAVGLFVEPNDEEVERALGAVALAALQVHAKPERAAALQSRFGVPVWRAVGVAGVADLPDEAPGVTRLLLDWKAGVDAPVPGGNARAFDWSVVRGWVAPVPWVLAGGLTPGNVALAIRATGAATVDVSSGVERRRGEKDPALIAAFVAAVRGRGAGS